jgi:hypothetical protein
LGGSGSSMPFPFPFFAAFPFFPNFILLKLLINFFSLHYVFS